jgi:hypothetical protein
MLKIDTTSKCHDTPDDALVDVRALGDAIHFVMRHTR